MTNNEGGLGFALALAVALAFFLFSVFYVWVVTMGCGENKKTKCGGGGGGGAARRLAEAVALLVGEAGADVVVKGVHLYRVGSNGSSSYRMLSFDRRSELVEDETLSFDDLDAAVEAFLSKVGLAEEEAFPDAAE